MEFEFDKEIDGLLRQSAQTVDVVSTGSVAHLEADEISLFAENSLPKAARVRAVEHFAECLRCRKILSGVISLNAENGSSTADAQPLSPAVPTSAAWYKKLFIFPQIGYAMGALALLLTGIIGSAILQNARNSQNDSVAQAEPVQSSQKSASEALSPSEPASSAARSAANTGTAVTSTPPAGSPMPSMSALSSNGSTAGTVRPNAPFSAPNPAAPTTMRDENLAESPAAESESKKAAPMAKAAGAAESKRENAAAAALAPQPPKKDSRFTTDGDDSSSSSSARARQMDESAQNSIVQNQTAVTPDSRNSRQTRQQLPLNNRSAGRQMSEKMTADSAAGKEKSKSAETRTAGGRVFKLSRGAWYDADYSQQETISVRRNSKEYKKLDAGLRSIAASIDGVVVVVWKGKAYRIQ